MTNLQPISKRLSLHMGQGRAQMGPGKPGESWNFIVAFSRTGKSWKVLEIVKLR